MKALHAAALAAAVYSASALAACANVLIPSYNLPRVAPGWQAQLIANGFKKPRTLRVDTEGNLLVLDAGIGVKRLKLTDNGGTCVAIAENKLLINMTGVSAPLDLPSFLSYSPQHELLTSRHRAVEPWPHFLR
jgi:hypothetical protein